MTGDSVHVLVNYQETASGILRVGTLTVMRSSPVLAPAARVIALISYVTVP